MADGDLLIERLLRVIDEGSRQTTYKLALVLALLDTSAARPGDDEIPTRAVAERVVELYWPQTRPYVDRGGTAHDASQIRSGRSVVENTVRDLRTSTGERSLERVRRSLPDEFEAAVERIEATFVKYPILRLQRVGGADFAFLYEIDWTEGTSSLSSLRRKGLDRLRLCDGVADRLAVLGPLIRPLVELHWTREVARWSKIDVEEEALRRHLFGASRTAFPRPLVGALHDLQHGECFYCAERIEGRGEVDHFLAWSRWPNDAIENLVLADRCNGHKSDHLAATAHLARWRFRNRASASDLVSIAETVGWASDGPRTNGFVQTTYAHLPEGTPLWVEGVRFEPLEGSGWDPDPT